jgi:hypothetical protein
MEVSGQLHAPATLPPGKEPLVPIGYEAGWALKLLWTLWWREKLPASTGNPTLEPHSCKNKHRCRTPVYALASEFQGINSERQNDNLHLWFFSRIQSFSPKVYRLKSSQSSRNTWFKYHLRWTVTCSGFIDRPDDLFTSAWSRDSQLLKVDPLGGVVLGASLVGRGSISVSDMRRNIER